MKNNTSSPFFVCIDGGKFVYDDGECDHLTLIIEPVLRMLRCKECGHMMDPIDVLIELARGERVF